jgi:hypothetical protein
MLFEFVVSIFVRASMIFKWLDQNMFETQLRKKSKLGTQREEVEPAVASIHTDLGHNMAKGKIMTGG